MKFSCTLSRPNQGQWLVRHLSADMGTIEVASPFREGALEKMRNELRDRLELSPCCAEALKNLPIELVVES